MTARVKICGLKERESVAAAISAGADFVGFVFYEPSPRHVALGDAMRLGELVPAGVKRVALVVDADEVRLLEIARNVKPDFFQAHGSETPERVRTIRAATGIPVIKAIKVEDASDLKAAESYRGAADMLLFDAKAPRDLAGALPGGNGLAFDWSLLDTVESGAEFILSGGLDADNVGQAIAVTGAAIVDVSTGVEKSPGIKDLDKIARFIAAAKGSGANRKMGREAQRALSTSRSDVS